MGERVVSCSLMMRLFRCTPHTTNNREWNFLRVLILLFLLSDTAGAVEKQVEAIVTTPDRVTVLTSGKVTYQHGRLAADALTGLPNRCYVDMKPVTLRSEVPRY